MGHYANKYPNPRKSQDYVPLCKNCKTVGHPTDECPNPKKDYQSNDRDWKKGKRVCIQEDAEGGSRNVNHIQHTIHPHPSFEFKVNAVTTRSKQIVEPLPVPDDKSDDKSLSYESSINQEPDNSIVLDPLAPSSSQRGSVLASVAPTLAVVQLVSVTIPISQSQPVATPHFIRQTNLPNIVSRANQAPVRIPSYSVLNLGHASRKSTSRRTQVMELAYGLHHYDIICDLDNVKSQITMRQLLAIALHAYFHILSGD